MSIQYNQTHLKLDVLFKPNNAMINLSYNDNKCETRHRKRRPIYCPVYKWFYNNACNMSSLTNSVC